MLMRPRYRRRYATATRFSVTFTTAIPRNGSVRVVSGLTRRSREGSAESGTTPQRTPGGTDPTGVPLAASLTNNSPLSGPPIDVLASPVARPIRSSGSPVSGCGPPPGAPPRPPGHAAAAISRVLASARFAQRRIELLDGELDIGLSMCRRDESWLEGRRGEEHAARERRLVPAREQRRVGLPGVGVVADGPGCEVQAPHRSRVSHGDRDAVPLRERAQASYQARRLLFQILIKTGTTRLPQGRESRGHRDRIPRERARLVNRPFGGDPFHQVRAATVGAHRKPAAHDLAERGEVRAHPKALLGAPAGHAESCHHLIKDQERTVLVTHGAQRRMKVGIRTDEPGIPDVRLDDDRRDPALVRPK